MKVSRLDEIKNCAACWNALSHCINFSEAMREANERIIAESEENIRQDERKKTLEFVANHAYMYITVGRDWASRRHYWVNTMLKKMQKEQKDE